MPYLIVNGDVRDSGRIYKCGEFFPGAKGSHADMEAVGAVQWVESPPRQAAPKPAAQRKSVKS